MYNREKIKRRIMYLTYDEDILRAAHEDLRESLVGVLRNEYLERFTNTRDLSLAIKPPPIFRAVVDMLVAQMLHHFTKTIIERIVDIIIRHEKEIRQ